MYVHVYIAFCYLSIEKKCLISIFAACKKVICCPLLFVHHEWKPSEPAEFESHSWLETSLTSTKVDFLYTFTVVLPSVTWTLDNSDLPLTRSNFCFLLRSFLYNFTFNNLNMFLVSVKLEKKPLYLRWKHWIYFKTTMSILCLEFIFFFVTPVKIQCPALYIKQALFLNSFFKILVFSFCCAFPPHPLVYLLISLEGSSYQESTVDKFCFSMFDTDWSHLHS